MTSISWAYGSDLGCLDFDESGQTIGRLCFTGTPRWIPAKLFTICQNWEKVWEIIPQKFSEVIKVEVFKDNLWSIVEHHAIAIEDGVLIRVRMDDLILKMVFVEDLRCQEISAYGESWEAQTWTRENVKVSEVTDPLAVKLEWINNFILKYGFSGIITIGIGLCIELAPIAIKALPALIEVAPALIDEKESVARKRLNERT